MLGLIHIDNGYRDFRRSAACFPFQRHEISGIIHHLIIIQADSNLFKRLLCRPIDVYIYFIQPTINDGLRLIRVDQ